VDRVSAKDRRRSTDQIVHGSTQMVDPNELLIRDTDASDFERQVARLVFSGELASRVRQCDAIIKLYPRFTYTESNLGGHAHRVEGDSLAPLERG